MHPEIQKAINALFEVVTTHAPTSAVAFKFFCNNAEIEAGFRYHSKESLKQDGISMRNLRGEWVK